MGTKKNNTIIAYKGFDKFLCCLDFQYEIGQEYDYQGEITLCKKGFHACTDPKDVLDYYSADISRYCKVELSGNIERENVDDGTKLCASHIKILEEVNILDEIIKYHPDIAKIFKKDEQTYIDDTFLGIVSNKDDWNAIKENCKVGSRILIMDGIYNIEWICVNIKDSKYALIPKEHIGFYYIDKQKKDLDSLYDSWVYNTILKELKSALVKIFGDQMKTVDKHKITLPSKKEVCRANTKGNFTYFKIANTLDIFYQLFHSYFWLRSGVSSSLFYRSDYIGDAICNVASARYCLRPLINVR